MSFFPQEKCGKRFGWSHHLAKHEMNVHVRSRPYKCSVQGCNWAFNDLSNRNMHERRVHKKGPPPKRWNDVCVVYKRKIYLANINLKIFISFTSTIRLLYLPSSNKLLTFQHLPTFKSFSLSWNTWWTLYWKTLQTRRRL